jgi:hypothetical protein
MKEQKKNMIEAPMETKKEKPNKNKKINNVINHVIDRIVDYNHKSNKVGIMEHTGKTIQGIITRLLNIK